MVTFRAAVASCPRKSGNHNSDNFYFNSKFITEDLMASQVMLAHKKSQDGIQMYAVTDGSSANAYKDEISLMLVRGLKKFHARLIDDPDLDPVKVIDEYNRDAYAAAKRRSLANESRPNSSLALMYINGRSLVFSNIRSRPPSDLPAASSSSELPPDYPTDGDLPSLCSIPEFAFLL